MFRFFRESLGTYTASSYSSATPPANTGPAITAKNVAITAQTIDVDGQILCGESTPSNWSVNLPTTLKADVSAYQQANNLAPTTSVRLSAISTVKTVDSGDSLIDGTYDPVTNQITLDDVTSLEGGGSVYLDGRIISTNTLGQISVQGGSGTVDVNNQSGIPLAVGNIAAGGNPTAPAEGDYVVDIDDTNPAGPSHKEYVYTAGQPIEVYDVASDGTLETPTQVSAASTTFQPVPGTEWQWVERVRLNDSTGQWSWNYPVSTPNNPASTPNNPWVTGGSPPVGDPSQPLSITQVSPGQFYINQQTFLGNENPCSFNFYAAAGTIGNYLTPLVFSVSGSTYTLAAVYQSIQVSQTGSNTEPLSLIGGSLSPNTTYVFGFCNQQVENTGTQGSPVLAWANSNSGTIPLSPADDPGAPDNDTGAGDWLYTANAVPLKLSMGLTLTNMGRNTGVPTASSLYVYTGLVFSASLSFSPQTQTGQIVNPGSPTYVSLGSNVFQETISDTATSTYIDLTLTNTVKADNPIVIDFSGVTSGSSVTITSDAPVTLTGDIEHADDGTSITATGDITNSAGASIGAKNLTLTATGGSIGSSAQPLNVVLWPNGSLTATADNQGVYLDLSSGASIAQITSGDTTDGYGDVVITASGDLLPESGLAAGTVNVTGDNITLTSTSTGGEVGNPASPLVIQANSVPAANGGVLGGVVNVTAQGDVGLVQNSGDLLVGTIQSTGHGAVAVSAPGGSILNAATWVAGGLSLAQAEAEWKALGLTDAAASQQSVTAFENEVNANYQQYWQLLGNGDRTEPLVHRGAGTQAVWNNATGGSFTLSTTVNGQVVTTGPIDYNATAGVMQTALAPLLGGTLTVTGSGTQADPWLISATGLGPLTTNDSQLTGGVTTVKPVPLGPQQVWTSATGGTFTLSAIVNGQIKTTGPIDYNASAAAIQTALSQVGVQAAVTGLGTPAAPWLISAATLPTLTINTTNLTTGSTVQAAAAGTIEVWNNAAGGSFTISATVNGQVVTTGPLDYNASAATIQAALSPLLGGTLTVTGSGTQADPWLITATGLSSLTTDDSHLLPSGTAQAAPALASTLWTSATGGQFTLSVIVNGQAETTGPIAYNASASTIQAALNSLTGVQATVTGSGTQADPWVLSGNGLSFLVHERRPVARRREHAPGRTHRTPADVVRRHRRYLPDLPGRQRPDRHDRTARSPTTPAPPRSRPPSTRSQACRPP